MRRKLFLWLIFISLSGLFIHWGIASQGVKNTPAKPHFTLTDLNGKKVSLEDYRGKIVMINIWATWCGPCRREIPDLVKIRDKYKDKGFEILGVVVSSKEADVKTMVEKYKINYPILWGTREAVATFGHVPAIPRTFILDREGNIVEDIEGSRDFEFFDGLLQKYFPSEKN